MKSSAEVLKTLRGRKRWPAAHERHQRVASLTLRDYLAVMRPTAQLLAEAMCAVDLSGCIQFANPRFQRLLARSESELVGKSICDFGHCGSVRPFERVEPNATNWCDSLTQRASVNFSEFGSCEWRRPDGSFVPSHCVLRPLIHEGQTLGMMLIAPSEPSDKSDAASDLASLEDVGPDGSQRALRAEAARMAMQVERRLRVVEALGDIALEQLPLDALLQALVDSMRREMGLENVALFLVSDEGDMVTARVASGPGAEIAETVRLPFGGGIIGEAMRTRRSILITDLQQLLARSAYYASELRSSVNLQSLVVAPLIVEDHSLGAIAIGSSEPDHFTSEDVRLVELAGERAAFAIERAHANDEAVRAHERLRFLNDASGALNATLDYRETTQRLATILTPALGDACAIYLLEDDGLLRKVATKATTHGLLAPDALDSALHRLVEGLAETVEALPDDTASAIGRSMRALTPVLEQQPLTLADDPAVEQMMSACICAPLVVRQHALGALYLATRPGKAFSAGDLALIQGLAERAAVAIDNARLYLETQQALASGSATATQLDTIFDATDVGIFVTDANGEFLRINPYGAHLFGLAQSSIERSQRAAEPSYTLCTPEGESIPPEREPIHLARVQGRPIEQHIVIHRRDSGKDIQALTRCTPWRDASKHIAGAIGVVTDITAIYELERQKDEFLGIASHELKTPLTSLKILAQLLARRMEASGETRDLEQAKRMQVAITRMERLINDLLDVSLIQEGKLALHREVADLSAICAEAVSEQELLSQRSIQFVVPSGGSLLIYADKERIYQVMTNLLSNALKYSPATETVVVRARATGEECIVSVQDHGSGVPPEAIDHIFDRFFRVPGMQVQSGSGVGLGLGLNISREIVQRHGGRIWVESKLGHGSVFSVALPRASAMTAAAVASDMPSA